VKPFWDLEKNLFYLKVRMALPDFLKKTGNPDDLY